MVNKMLYWFAIALLLFIPLLYLAYKFYEYRKFLNFVNTDVHRLDNICYDILTPNNFLSIPLFINLCLSAYGIKFRNKDIPLNKELYEEEYFSNSDFDISLFDVKDDFVVGLKPKLLEPPIDIPFKSNFNTSWDKDELYKMAFLFFYKKYGRNPYLSIEEYRQKARVL